MFVRSQVVGCASVFSVSLSVGYKRGIDTIPQQVRRFRHCSDHIMSASTYACVSALLFLLAAGIASSAPPKKEQRQIDCFATANMYLGDTYTFNTPNFPNAYPPGLQCRWVAYSPANTAFEMQCNHFYVVSSPGCSLDAFYFSFVGDTTLQNANYYCGSGILHLTTDGNVFAAGFVSSYFTPSSYGFSCALTVVAKSSGTIVTTPDPNPPATPPVTTQPPSGGCQCGVKGGSRIVGGHEAEVNEWPWHVGLYHNSISDSFCGASLIHEQWVLTAAHCVEQFSATDLYVILGDHVQSQNTDSQYNVRADIDSYIIHENYNPNTVDNDIALIRLTEPVTFNGGISPICLPFGIAPASLSGQNGTVTGWGQVEFNGDVSDVLLEVELPLLTTIECQQFPNVSSSITNNMICTYKPGYDACKGDSGGPLQWDNGNNEYLVGIVSFGVGCANVGFPGVYTKVTNYLQWIQDNTMASDNTPAVFCSP